MASVDAGNNLALHSISMTEAHSAGRLTQNINMSIDLGMQLEF